MRLLHTSDWHLGRSLHRADLRDAQAGFLDDLVETVRHERVDVVLVSGDVYDRAIPPVEAVELCESAFVRLREVGAKVVVISGNHDSARRLGFGSALFAASGVFVRTRVQRCAEPIVLDGVSVFAVPYLEPEAVRSLLPPDPALGGGAGLPRGVEPGGAQPEGAAPPRGHAGVLGRALACARAALATPQSVVLAHAWVGGGLGSDSERDITVGGVGAVPASLFDGFTYSALGHLHGPQVLAPGLRYSGSPLAYSFSEAAHTKGSWLVELTAAGLGVVEHVPAAVPRRLSLVSGPLDALLTGQQYDAVRDDWLSVVLTDTVRPEEAMTRLRSRFPGVLVLDWRPTEARYDDRSYVARLRGKGDRAISEEFVQHVRRSEVTQDERALLGEAFEAGREPAA